MVNGNKTTFQLSRLQGTIVNTSFLQKSAKDLRADVSEGRVGTVGGGGRAATARNLAVQEFFESRARDIEREEARVGRTLTARERGQIPIRQSITQTAGGRQEVAIEAGRGGKGTARVSREQAEATRSRTISSIRGRTGRTGVTVAKSDRGTSIGFSGFDEGARSRIETEASLDLANTLLSRRGPDVKGVIDTGFVTRTKELGTSLFQEGGVGQSREIKALVERPKVARGVFGLEPEVFAVGAAAKRLTSSFASTGVSLQKLGRESLVTAQEGPSSFASLFTSFRSDVEKQRETISQREVDKLVAAEQNKIDSAVRSSENLSRVAQKKLDKRAKTLQAQVKQGKITSNQANTKISSFQKSLENSISLSSSKVRNVEAAARKRIQKATRAGPSGLSPLEQTIDTAQAKEISLGRRLGATALGIPGAVLTTPAAAFGLFTLATGKALETTSTKGPQAFPGLVIGGAAAATGGIAKAFRSRPAETTLGIAGELAAIGGVSKILGVASRSRVARAPAQIRSGKAGTRTIKTTRDRVSTQLSKTKGTVTILGKEFQFSGQQVRRTTQLRDPTQLTGVALEEAITDVTVRRGKRTVTSQEKAIGIAVSTPRGAQSIEKFVSLSKISDKKTLRTAGVRAAETVKIVEVDGLSRFRTRGETRLTEQKLFKGRRGQIPITATEKALSRKIPPFRKALKSTPFERDITISSEVFKTSTPSGVTITDIRSATQFVDPTKFGGRTVFSRARATARGRRVTRQTLRQLPREVQLPTVVPSPQARQALIQFRKQQVIPRVKPTLSGGARIESQAIQSSRQILQQQIGRQTFTKAVRIQTVGLGLATIPKLGAATVGATALSQFQQPSSALFSGQIQSPRITTVQRIETVPAQIVGQTQITAPIRQTPQILEPPSGGTGIGGIPFVPIPIPTGAAGLPKLPGGRRQKKTSKIIGTRKFAPTPTLLQLGLGIPFSAKALGKRPITGLEAVRGVPIKKKRKPMARKKKKATRKKKKR